jgi:7-cyano-7-deazaguanine synthase in queuosine biosynthesis
MAERLVLCGQAEVKCAQDEETLRLSLNGSRPNIALRIEDVSRRMVANVPNLLTDLVEIATYVFCADQAVSRGGEVMKAMGTTWRRQFRFVIPVREPERWSSPEVSGALTDALTFLSDDEFRFEFTELSRPRAFQSYLDLERDASAAFRPDEVVLFSGGLDSLGGAIEELAGHGRGIALVSHQSSPKMSKRQKQLAAELTHRFPGRVLHVPVRVTRQGRGAPETTQRTRTFLFASLAIVVARMLGRNRILFFENGVVSFNLPIASQVVGTRATRTTHPRVLYELGRFLTALLTIEVKVDNPFIWMTKAEVAKLIAAHSPFGEL